MAIIDLNPGGPPVYFNDVTGQLVSGAGDVQAAQAANLASGMFAPGTARNPWVTSTPTSAVTDTGIIIPQPTGVVGGPYAGALLNLSGYGQAPLPGGGGGVAPITGQTAAALPLTRPALPLTRPAPSSPGGAVGGSVGGLGGGGLAGPLPGSSPGGVGGGGGGGGGSLGGITAGPPAPRYGQQQQEEENRTGRGSVFQRYLEGLPGYGGMLPGLQSYMMNQGRDREAQYFLNEFGRTDAPKTFYDYLREQGSQEPNIGDIRANLKSFLDVIALLENPNNQVTGNALALVDWGRRASEGPGGDAIPWNVVSAMMQPGLAGMAPALRPHYRSAMSDRASSYFANKPGDLSGFISLMRQLGLA